MALSEATKGIVIGALAAVAGHKVEEKIEEQFPHLESPWEEFIKDFPLKFSQLCTDIHALANAETLVPLITNANLMAYPAEEVLKYKGRKHLSIYCTSSFAVRLFTANAGVYSPNLNAGWNALDLPEGSTIALPQGTNGVQLVMIMVSDISLGNAI